MRLEIDDIDTRTRYTGKNGFMFYSRNYNVISSIQTDEGNYVVELMNSYVQIEVVTTLKTLGEVKEYLKQHITADEHHLLSKVNYKEFSYIREVTEAIQLNIDFETERIYAHLDAQATIALQETLLPRMSNKAETLMNINKPLKITGEQISKKYNSTLVNH